MAIAQKHSRIAILGECLVMRLSFKQCSDSEQVLRTRLSDEIDSIDAKQRRRVNAQVRNVAANYVYNCSDSLVW